MPSIAAKAALESHSLTKTSDGASNGDSTAGVQAVGASGVPLSAAPAVPDANGGSPHRVLSAEKAGVLGVLRNLHLLHLLTEGGTITGSVLSHDADLLCSLRHGVCLVASASPAYGGRNHNGFRTFPRCR